MQHTLWTFAVFILVILFVAAGCGGEEGTEGNEMTADTVGTAPMSSPAQEPAMPGTVQKINLNTASSDEFRTIPNVGDRMVREFEEYRPYISIQQFRREMGKYVDEGQIAEYEQYVYVPIDPNESDSETLMQIPGLDASEASALTEARPFDSDDAFLNALSEYVSQSELETAEGYLAEG